MNIGILLMSVKLPCMLSVSDFSAFTKTKAQMPHYGTDASRIRQ
jgi:hypothetical protein